MFATDESFILKGIGGFYTIRTPNGVLTSKAKGIFRKLGITPLAGDVVTLEESHGDYVIAAIRERKNSFLRPPVANVDTLFLVVSTVAPLPNLNLIDHMTALSLDRGIFPVILVTKTDLQKNEALFSVYHHAGFEVVDIRNDFSAAKKQILDRMDGHFSVFTGNSGVGKSTLLNDLFALDLPVGETSKKLGRGRHITRAVELFPFAGGYFADTPGFSALDLARSSGALSGELDMLFPEFRKVRDACRFVGCSHLSEPDCMVKRALEEGAIGESRYQSYSRLYKETKKEAEYHPQSNPTRDR